MRVLERTPQSYNYSISLLQRQIELVSNQGRIEYWILSNIVQNHLFFLELKKSLSMYEAVPFVRTSPVSFQRIFLIPVSEYRSSNSSYFEYPVLYLKNLSNIFICFSVTPSSCQSFFFRNCDPQLLESAYSSAILKAPARDLNVCSFFVMFVLVSISSRFHSSEFMSSDLVCSFSISRILLSSPYIISYPLET